MAQGAALYVHWPFCKKKCPYCDFNSHVRDRVDHAAWCGALLKELRYWHARAPDVSISSIFFGGGTPSLMEAETVAAIIAHVQALWPAAPAGREITLEANPTSVEAKKFREFAAAGVNRVSLGVQSLRAESLAFLGREHSAREALNAIEIAAQHFARYSFDLIYALPNQTAVMWEAELREALHFARGHLSLYQLTIEENTAFHHAYHVGKEFILPEENLAADLYTLTGQIMSDVGMPAYEISNYAAPGQESRHNLSYWRGDMYFGIGPGAHGRVDLLCGGSFSNGWLGSASPTHSRLSPTPPDACAAARDGTLRGELSPLRGSSGWKATQDKTNVRITTRNLKSPERWLDSVQKIGHGLEEETQLNVQERAEEKILMGLRLTQEGARFDRFRADERAYLDGLWSDGRVEKFVQMGLVDVTPESIRATARGQLVLNTLIEELVG